MLPIFGNTKVVTTQYTLLMPTKICTLQIRLHESCGSCSVAVVWHVHGNTIVVGTRNTTATSDM